MEALQIILFLPQRIQNSNAPILPLMSPQRNDVTMMGLLVSEFSCETVLSRSHVWYTTCGVTAGLLLSSLCNVGTIHAQPDSIRASSKCDV